MNPLAQAVLKTGLIDEPSLREFRRWGGSLELPTEPSEPASLEAVSQAIEEALQSEGLVALRETDLGILDRYLQTQHQATLFVRDDNDQVVRVPVLVGTTETGDFIIPWKSESIRDLMTHEKTFLTYGSHNYYFHDVQELFFGDVKAFMVCKASNIDTVASLPGATDGNPS